MAWREKANEIMTLVMKCVDDDDGWKLTKKSVSDSESESACHAQRALTNLASLSLNIGKLNICCNVFLDDHKLQRAAICFPD